MAVQDLPASTNFQVHYEDSIANSKTRAQVIAAACENEFNILTNWFAIKGAFGPGDRIQVYLDQPDGTGANNFGYQSGGRSNIHLDVQSSTPNAANAAEVIKMLFVAELVEVFMSYNNQHGPTTWNRGDSAGEGLSQLCNILRFRTGHYLYYGSWVDAWLQIPPPPGPPGPDTRPDWITTPKPTDTDPVSFGCSLLFLYYLISQLGFSIESVIQKGGTSLEALYTNLTGKTGAFGTFLGLVSQYFPQGKTPPFLTFDNPFPLEGPNQRQVTATFTIAPYQQAFAFARGTAHVQPYFLCPGGDYQFEIDHTPQLITCTASATGFAQPVFSWRVNGVDVPPGSGSISVQATASVDDTSNPQNHTTGVQTLTMTTTTDAPQTTLTLRLPASAIGHFDLVIEPLAAEKFVSPQTQTSGIEFVTAHNETVVWDAKYQADRKACQARWNDLLHRFATFKDIPIILTLPDPPEEYTRFVRQIETVSLVLHEARRQAPELAEALEKGIRGILGLSPHLVGEIAEHTSRSNGR